MESANGAAAFVEPLVDQGFIGALREVPAGRVESYPVNKSHVELFRWIVQPGLR